MKRKATEELKREDLLECEDDYIIHQCNCVTTNSKGLAFEIFQKYPYANTYIKGKRTPGTIDVFDKERGIINMYAQKYPGKPTPYESNVIRIKWFEECLTKIEQHFSTDKMISLAFPYKIGCNLAGGNWDTYSSMIESFAERNKTKFTVRVLRFD